jgi:hypothetical protein
MREEFALGLLLRILTKLISAHYLLEIYHAPFHSILSYGLLWGHLSACQDVLKIQKRAYL